MESNHWYDDVLGVQNVRACKPAVLLGCKQKNPVAQAGSVFFF